MNITLSMTSLLLVAPILLGNTQSAFGSIIHRGGNVQSVNTQVEIPICYMQTSDGRTIDLSKSCGFIKPSICLDSLGTPERNAVLLDFCKKNNRCELNGTCNQMPKSINAPPPGTPLGMISPNKAINDSLLYAERPNLKFTQNL
jgi:hypothetical protein